jgi:hypothetical protein
VGSWRARAWYTKDGSAFYAIAKWDTRDDANTIFQRWHIEDEPGKVAIRLTGDLGLVPEP